MSPAHLPLAWLALTLVGPADRPAPEGRRFELTVQATVRDVPEGCRALDLWLPLPPTDADQTIERVAIDAPGPLEIAREPKHGNQMIHVRLRKPQGPVAVGLRIEATRRRAGVRPATLTPEEHAAALAAEPLVPLDGPVRALAEEAVRGQMIDAAKARAIFETVATRLRYDKSGIGWGHGDALFACSERRGNCTDFHALTIGMARSQGIPARFVIGLPLPPEGTTKPTAIPGYHCWAEVYLDGRSWVPVDASEASKAPARRDDYYARLPADRIEFSRGRHLTLAPPQRGAPRNYFVDPYAEADGRPVEVERAYSAADLPARRGDRAALPALPEEH